MIPDLVLAAKGCFRFCTPGQRMLPRHSFMGEIHPRKRAAICPTRPKDGSRRGQGMLQVTYMLRFSFCLAPICLGAQRSERSTLPRTRPAFLGGPPQAKRSRAGSQEGWGSRNRRPGPNGPGSRAPPFRRARLGRRGDRQAKLCPRLAGKYGRRITHEPVRAAVTVSRRVDEVRFPATTVPVPSS